MEKVQEAISYLEGLIRDTDLVIPACSPELRRKLEAQREYYELAVEALSQTLKTGEHLTRAEAAEAHVEQLSERLKHEAENYHAGIELAESLRRSAEARAEKAERELEAVITAINNGYRIGAITIRSPKFILPGIRIEPCIRSDGWCRTVKEE